VGILAFYREQANLISELLRNEGIFDVHCRLKDKENPQEQTKQQQQQQQQQQRRRGPCPLRVEVMTVDSSQGDEFDVVIVSAAREREELGFLRKNERINVSCTRVREVLCILGSHANLCQQPLFKRFHDAATKLKVMPGDGSIGWQPAADAFDAVAGR
jgi:superfamily I DNA and/or RNA helicase